jgi:hypothetical protein
MPKFLVIDEQVIKELHDALGHEYVPTQYGALRELMLIAVTLDCSDFDGYIFRPLAKPDPDSHVALIDGSDGDTVRSIATATAIAKKGHDASETAKLSRDTTDRKDSIPARGGRASITGHRRR